MVIDLSDVSTTQELHILLANELSFPEFYGKNWDAFWDSITNLVKMPANIEIRCFNKLQEILPRDAHHLYTCLKEMNEQYPQIQCVVSYA